MNSDQQNRGLQADSDLSTATRPRGSGITPQMIDDTLYDAFGQRQVSTMYTPLNQYHVVMEVEPQFWQNPRRLRHIYVKSPNGNEVPLDAFTHYEPDHDRPGGEPPGPVPLGDHFVQPAPRALSLGDAVSAIEEATRKIGLPASIRGRLSWARPRPSRPRWPTSRS